MQLGCERPTSTRVPETLPPPPPRSRRTPSHVTTCAAAVAAAANVSRQLPARSRQRITSEHEKAPARGPAHRSPNLSFAGLGPFLLGSTRSRQGDLRERETVFGARLLLLIVLWSPSLASHPRTLASPSRTVPELVSSSRPHLFCLPLEAQ